MKINKLFPIQVNVTDLCPISKSLVFDLNLRIFLIIPVGIREIYLVPLSYDAAADAAAQVKFQTLLRLEEV